MPEYRVTYSFRSTDNGETTKTYVGTFATAAAAATAADDLLTDLLAATDAAIYKRELTEVATYATAASGSKSVFLRASATVSLVGKVQKGNFTLPAPVNAINGAGSEFDSTATAWTNLVENFQSPQLWRISDGDEIDTTLTGKTAYYGSGETNF